MTSTAKIRRLITINGKRVSFDLTAGEWAAVERAAAAAGVRVSAWVNQQAAAAQDAGAGNLTAYVRTAATEAALAALAEMESRAALPPATGFEQANTPDDRDFADMVAAAQINGTVDLIGCTVSAGVNESGCVAFYIRNGLRDGLHMTISTPMTPEEWRERMGADAL